MSKVKISELADKLFESVKVYVDACLERDAKEQEKKMKQYVNKKIKEAMK